MDGDRVTADAPALRGHLSQTIGDETMAGGPFHGYFAETHLQFHVSAVPPHGDALAGFADAIDVANAVSLAAGQEMQAAAPVSAPDGPVTTLEFSGADDAPERWLAALSSRLSDAGFAGEVVPRAGQSPPEWVLRRLDERGLVTFLVLPARTTRTDRGQGFPGLDVIPAGVPADARDWLLREPGDLLVTVGSFGVATGPADPFLDDLFDDVAGAYPNVSALLTGPPGTRYRFVTAPAQGPTLYGAGDENAPLAEQLAVLREPLLAHAGRAHLGFVRRTLGPPTGWTGVSAPHGFPFVEGYEVWTHASLLSRYIPDVHGIQVLSDAHLAGLPDPGALAADWIVEPLGAGRHLVTARDLDAWYAPSPPSPMIEAARRLFDPILLTSRIIAG